MGLHGSGHLALGRGTDAGREAAEGAGHTRGETEGAQGPEVEHVAGDAQRHGGRAGGPEVPDPLTGDALVRARERLRRSGHPDAHFLLVSDDGAKLPVDPAPDPGFPGRLRPMDHRTIARISAAGRVAIGAALLVAPAAVTRGWTGSDGATTGGRLLGRSLGARDLVLGIGVLRGLERGDTGARHWVKAAAMCDAVDAVATAASLRHLPRRSATAVVALAAGAAVAGFVAADNLD